MADREKLIELLKEADRKAYEVVESRPLAHPFEVWEIQADHLIANGVTIQRWIPASKPPQKITNKVIVLCKNGYRGFGHYEDYNGKQTWYNLENDRPFTDWDLEDCESYEVTHWMPLPEAPKGE